MKKTIRYLLGGLIFVSLISPAAVAYGCPTDMGSFWDWITCVRANWIYEDDADGEPCAAHLFSQIRLRGDCDDFAVLVAWAAEEEFGLDSFILLLTHSSWEYGHALAFIEASSELHYERTKKSCVRETAISRPLTDYTYPEVYTDHPGTSEPRTYYSPVDFLRCPDSVMDIDVNNATRYSWSELEGVDI